MIYIFISFIDNLALFYLSLDGTLFPDVSTEAHPDVVFSGLLVDALVVQLWYEVCSGQRTAMTCLRVRYILPAMPVSISDFYQGALPSLSDMRPLDCRPPLTYVIPKYQRLHYPGKLFTV